MSPVSFDDFEYAGFWVRTGAALIDTVLILAVTLPLLFVLYGRAYFDVGMTHAGTGPSGFADVMISWIAPAVAAIAFWIYKQATPGKMVFAARVVDARHGGPLTVRQSVIRYLGYFVSTIPLGLGLLWVAFDSRKQGWHDKLAGTVVIRPKQGRIEPVRFDR